MPLSKGKLSRLSLIQVRRTTREVFFHCSPHENSLFALDLYIDRTVCSVSGGPDPNLVRCCTSASDSGCHRVPAGHTCLDNTGLPGIVSNATKPVIFDGLFANPTQCDVAVLTIEAVQGDPQVYFSFSSSVLNPSAQNSHAALMNAGTEWLQYCCASDFQAALERAGSREIWDGRVIGTIVPVGNFAVSNVFVDTTAKLNMTRYWRSVAPTLQINDGVVSGNIASSVCRDDIVCGLLAPADDPVANDFRVQSPFPPVFPYKAKTHTFALVNKVTVAGGPDGTNTVEIIPSRWLPGGAIKLRYDLLQTLTSQPLQNVGDPKLYRPTCSSADFSAASTQLRSVISGLSDPDTLPSLQTFQYTIQQAASYVLSDAWVACETFARDELLSVRNQTITKQSLACQYAPGSAGYASSPCCNPTLALTQCCAAQTVASVSTAYTPNQAKLDSSCSFSRCGTIAASDYASLIAQDVVLDGCGSDLESTFKLLSADVNAVPQCMANNFGQRCQSDSDCAGSWCAPTGVCAKVCTQNSDCASASCVSLPNTVKVCVFLNESSSIDRTSSSFLPCLLNATESNELFDPILRAVAGVSSSASDFQFATAFWNAFSTQDTCVGPFSADLFDTKSDCETPVCNWASCSSILSSDCNTTNCVTNARSSSFCGECHGSLCEEKSSFGGCFAPGGSYSCSSVVPGAAAVWPSGDCLLPSSFDGDQCFVPDFCPVRTSPRLRKNSSLTVSSRMLPRALLRIATTQESQFPPRATRVR